MTFRQYMILAAGLVASAASAQQTVGSWEFLASYDVPERIEVTADKVYCLSDGSLFSYDYKNDESYFYSLENHLTEPRISNIYYNRYGKYLAVAYPTGNIDIIRDNGEVVNLPDIRDAVMTVSRSINDIYFEPGLMYVATNFGLVIYDDTRLEVKETAMYEKAIQYFTATKDYYVAVLADKVTGCVMPKTADIKKFDNYTTSNIGTATIGIVGNDANNGVVMRRAANIGHYNIESDKTLKNSYWSNDYKNSRQCGESKNGAYTSTADALITIVSSETANTLQAVTLPDPIKGDLVGYYDDPNTVWAADDEGLGCYDISGGVCTVKVQKFRPNAMYNSNVGRLYFSPSGKLYASIMGYSHGLREWGDFILSNITIFDGETFHKATPHNMRMISRINSQWNPGGSDGTGRLAQTGNIIEDPDNSDIYYVTDRWNGAFKVSSDGEQIVSYNETNSPMYDDWGLGASAVDIDKNGNLWLVMQRGDLRETTGQLLMLPADKRKAAEVNTSDWYIVHNKFKGERDNQLLCLKDGRTVLFTCWGAHGFVMVDTKGTNNPSDDVDNFILSFVDQDGKTFTIGNVYTIFQDSKNWVWVVHELGVFAIPNADNIKTGEFTCIRPKINRNDGTGFADYLLDNQFCTNIAEDSAGCLWIGTVNSGVYKVSSEGNEIIENFNTDNSILPYNAVYAIACDPKSNAVYFGTKGGVVRYNSYSSPGAEDYSSVYAFPNPVRPDYTGWITISGLMTDSLVKITDASGAIVHQGQADGGMYTWDGCNLNGARVNTGVYYVFASKGSGQEYSDSAVTKILVVK